MHAFAVQDWMDYGRPFLGGYFFKIQSHAIPNSIIFTNDNNEVTVILSNQEMIENLHVNVHMMYYVSTTSSQCLTNF